MAAIYQNSTLILGQTQVKNVGPMGPTQPEIPTPEVGVPAAAGAGQITMVGRARPRPKLADYPQVHQVLTQAPLDHHPHLVTQNPNDISLFKT